jgi:hypothetical protein
MAWIAGVFGTKYAKAAVEAACTLRLSVSFHHESTRGLTMYRTLVCLFCLAVTFATVGCAEKHTATKTSEIKTPGGTETQKVTVEEKKTGDLKDPNAHNTNTSETTTTTTNP